jgi:hypothetical protein
VQIPRFEIMLAVQKVREGKEGGRPVEVFARNWYRISVLRRGHAQHPGFISRLHARHGIIYLPGNRAPSGKLVSGLNPKTYPGREIVGETNFPNFSFFLFWYFLLLLLPVATLIVELQSRKNR